MRFTVDRLDHLVINCRDVEISAALYQRVLGMDREEFGVDAALFAGGFTGLAVREKVMTPPPYRQELLYLLPPRIGAAQHAAIFAAVEAAARALGLTDCLMHADVMVDGEGRPSIVELSGRATGNNVAARLYPTAFDADPIALALAALASARPVTAPVLKRPVAFAFLDLPEGRVLRFNTERARRSAGVLALASRVQRGDRLGPLRSGSDAFQRGWLMAGGADGEAALANARRALGAVEIEVESADAALL